MKKITVFNAATLVALLMLFFACNSGTPGMQKPDIPQNPKEKQEPEKPEAKDPETKKPETPPTPTPPQEDPKKPEPKQPETPPTPAPPKEEPKKPETPPTPAPPRPAPPTPAPTPVPPTPAPPTPVPPTPPAPKPPKEKVLTIVGQWRQTESASDYDTESSWKTSQANLTTIYTFNKDGKYTLDVDFQGFPPSKATGSYTFVDRKLTIKVENGQAIGAQGAFEIKHIVWNDNGTADEIWIKEVNGTKGYKLSRLKN